MYSITVGKEFFNLTSPTQKELDIVPKENLENIGSRIKNLRQDRGITQAKMAEELYKTSQAYGNIEAGKVKSLSATDIETICKKLNTTYHYLLGYTTDPACGSTAQYRLTDNGNTHKDIHFMKEIDFYENEVIITKGGKEIFKEDINLDRRKITEYIKSESCPGDVTIVQGLRHTSINSNLDVYSKIRLLHGDISIFNGKNIKAYKNIDKVREHLVECLSKLKDFAKMKVTKSGREIEYTIFLNDDGTAIYLRDERNLINLIAPAVFKSAKPETAESDSNEFHKALNKIIFDTDYHSTDGLFILDEFIRAMDVEPSQRELLKKELSVLIDKYSK